MASQLLAQLTSSEHEASHINYRLLDSIFENVDDIMKHGKDGIRETMLVSIGFLGR